jgi:UDP-GlcNAc:undecaprenyl-phosphate GlcNAc-1-phosphate transferase
MVWCIPLAILWIVGITNAINLLDNMDGLSAGVSLLCAALMALHAAFLGDTLVALGALVIAGVCAGFLAFNFHPARIFMGDCGTMFLGFSLACLSLMGSSGLLSGNLFSALLLPTLVLATPIFEMGFVAVVRFINGRPISLGGRDHTSHRLVLLGLSEPRAVLWLYGITLWFGGISLWGSLSRNWMAVGALTALSWLALLVFGLFLAEVETYTQEEFEKCKTVLKAREDKVVLSRVIRYKRRVVEALLDFIAICACWVGAYQLRFDGQLGLHAHDLIEALPYVIGCQLGAFYVCGLYRNSWRYVTIADLMSIARGALLGAAASYLLLEMVAPVHGSVNSIVVVDALLLLVTVGGMRLALKALRFHFALKGREGLKRVLICGASDAGILALREMLANNGLFLLPVGFLDDDPQKQLHTFHGIKVLGTTRNLVDIVQRHRVDEVVIATDSPQGDNLDEVVRLCRGEGISCRDVRGLIL